MIWHIRYFDNGAEHSIPSRDVVADVQGLMDQGKSVTQVWGPQGDRSVRLRVDRDSEWFWTDPEYLNP